MGVRLIINVGTGVETRVRGKRLCTLALGAWPLVVPGSSRAQGHEVPMKDVAVQGTVQKAALDVMATASVQTPIGRVPVTAHIRVSYDCSAAFTGTVTYNPLVRLFARIKQVDLVTAVDGTVKTDSTSECLAITANSLLGHANVETTVMSGWVKLDNDSIPFTGPAWAIGDSSYHSVVSVMRGGRQFEIRINMYENGIPKVPNSSVVAGSDPRGARSRTDARALASATALGAPRDE